MGWLITTVLIVWLVPPVAAAGAALACLLSSGFRAWLVDVLFGEGFPTTRPLPEGAVRPAER